MLQLMQMVSLCTLDQGRNISGGRMPPMVMAR